MSTRPEWQAEADLLAEGLEELERQCATTRYRHLFPTGPNLALLLQAYQELDRWRTVHRREHPPTSRRLRRRFRRMIKRLVRVTISTWTARPSCKGRRSSSTSTSESTSSMVTG